MSKTIVQTITYNCNLCGINIDIEEGFLEYKGETSTIHICKKCLNKLVNQANDEDLLDENIFM